MVIHTFSRQNSFALEQECSWDPAAVLEIINRDTRGFTCVGYAPSQGRRCRNPIAQCNRERVFDMLDTLALSPSSSRKVASMLPRIAALSLCRRYHQDQVDEVVEKWQARITSRKPRKVRTSSWRVDEDIGSYITAKTATWRTRQMSPERPKEKPCTTGPTPAQEKQRWRGEDYQSKRERERERLEEELERMIKELERLRNGKQERERKTKETKDKENQEKKEREERDEEKREQMRKEQEKKDQERREREKKARQEQEAREQQERIKRAAEQKREERKRQERAKAAKEKEEWRKTWENYERCWAKFKSSSGSVQGDIHNAIPWPVKSGRYADVKKKDTRAAMIEEFFRKGCLEMRELAAAYSLIGEESKKWHPDKLAALFRGMPIGDEEKEAVTIIGQIVIKLRLETKILRDGLRGR
jgi:hypothetical protein